MSYARFRKRGTSEKRMRFLTGGSEQLNPSARLQAVGSAAELDAAIRESNEHPVLLLVHSRECGLSHIALAEIREHLRQWHAPVIYIITVQTHRHLCETLTQTFGLRHETPRAMLVHAGTVVWHRTHHRITAEALAAALRLLPLDTPASP